MIDNDTFAFFDLDTVLAAAALLAAHYESFGGGLPEEIDVRRLARKCLEVYDAEIDSYTPREPFKVRRREVVVETFRKLDAVQRQRPRME